MRRSFELGILGVLMCAVAFLVERRIVKALAKRR